ncbi:DIL domain-containing protein [Coprinopsis sp. MPI-PUGE-AT-0042]|nr:DIL domain-containing protein [Coprinopsis sp. MPI-PUGE-AT-0042]
MANLQPFNLDPEPDLHPLYPSTQHLQKLLSSDSGLDSGQKAELVVHCLKRACLFADLSILQFLLSDRAAQVYVDLGIKDEDGASLISLTIHGFGGDLDRDVEREECVRYLVSQGADLSADNAGWTPLHHAAIIAPPTLVSYLMTHGCSPFEVTHRKLTPLDIVTAHSVLPEREDVALLLEEAMRGEGWSGGPIERRRRLHERREKRRGKRKAIRDDVSKVLGVQAKWWEPEEGDIESEEENDERHDSFDDSIYTPHPDYASMLVFSPTSLPRIFDSVITNYPVQLKDPTPAQTLYLLARFACLTCDHLWLEDLIIGATDSIEDAFFNNPDDLPTLIFWLHNTVLWLHLLQCDKSLRPACEILGSFELIEEVINSVFVFIIRFAERKIDQLLDPTVLDYAPSGSESETVKFESEWSFLRPFTKKKAPAPPPVAIGSLQHGKNPLASPTASIRTLGSTNLSPTTPKFSSIRQTLARAQSGATGAPLSALFTDPSSAPSTYELTSFLTALHTLLAFADINPIFTTQLWSQVFYWTSCEIFNRVVTRKKYLCRTRAMQIQANLNVIEDWADEMGIPPGVLAHFAPVKDLLTWLQCLSSVADFPDLVSIIQSLKHLNPLQMRRAIRDYKYEVNESRMNDECIQYVIQLQKDWERHRVKLGVEILRKEISDRDREREETSSTLVGESSSISDQSSIMSTTSLDPTQRNGIDLLLDRDQDRSWWQPIRAPQALGELLDSRHMLPLLFPDDPKLLAAHPSRAFLEDVTRGATSPASTLSPPGSAKSSIDLGNPGGPLLWRSRDSQVRDVDPHVLQILDGPHTASQWWKNYDLPLDLEDHQDHDNVASPERVEHPEDDVPQLEGDEHLPTPLTVRKPSIRTKGRPNVGDVTPVEGSFHMATAPCFPMPS